MDVGAANHVWNYGGVFHDCVYKTLEISDGAIESRGNSDYVVDGYDWSRIGHAARDYWDVIVCGQVLEHDRFFWRTCANIGEAVKVGGFAVIIVPSSGPIHRFPKDYYRFYPDSAEVFSECAGMRVVDMVHDTTGMSEWSDLCVIMKKEA